MLLLINVGLTQVCSKHSMNRSSTISDDRHPAEPRKKTAKGTGIFHQTAPNVFEEIPAAPEVADFLVGAVTMHVDPCSHSSSSLTFSASILCQTSLPTFSASNGAHLVDLLQMPQIAKHIIFAFVGAHRDEDMTWTRQEHWQGGSAQSCPCCRSKYFEWPGSCEQCDDLGWIQCACSTMRSDLRMYPGT